MGRSTPYDPEDLWKAEIVSAALGRLGPPGRPGGRAYRLLVHVHRFGQALELFPLYRFAGGYDDPEVKRQIEEDRQAEIALNRMMVSLGIVTADMLQACLRSCYKRVFVEYELAKQTRELPDMIALVASAPAPKPARKRKKKEGVDERKTA